MQTAATNKADLNLFFVTGVYFQPADWEKVLILAGTWRPCRHSNNRDRQRGRRRESKRIVR